MRSRYFNMAGSTSEKRINPSRRDSKGLLCGGVEAEVKRPPRPEVPSLSGFSRS